MLEREDAIKNSLMERFDFMAGKCEVKRERRLTAECPREKLLEVMAYLKDGLGFQSLCTITGLDSGENYELIYHLANVGIVLNLKTTAPKADPVFDTVTEIFNGATMHELEARNLLGLTIQSLPADIKYPLPDDWPEGEHPLRKDWKKEMPAPGAEGGNGNG